MKNALLIPLNSYWIDKKIYSADFLTRNIDSIKFPHDFQLNFIRAIIAVYQNVIKIMNLTRASNSSSARAETKPFCLDLAASEAI